MTPSLAKALGTVTWSVSRCRAPSRTLTPTTADTGTETPATETDPETWSWFPRAVSWKPGGSGTSLKGTTPWASTSAMVAPARSAEEVA